MQKTFLFICFVFLLAVSINGQQITSKTVTVNAKQYWSEPIIINKDNQIYATNFQVENYDIEIYILDNENLMKFIKGQNFSSYHYSGKRSSGVIHLRLPKGVYSLIVNNRYASFYSKKVTLTYFK